MKKFLSYILIIVVLIGFLAPATSLYAQDVVYPGPTDGSPVVNVGGAGTSGTPPENENDCTLFSNWDQCILNGLTRVAFIIMGLMSLLLYLAGTLLDFVITFTIVNMRENIKGLTGINIAWKVIRDLMNIAFIFLLVYEGIKIIVDQSDLTKVKKFVSMVVLASLLINFSLFFTKVLIDASNIVTIGLYNATIEKPGSASGEASSGGLSIPFMRALGVSSFYSSTAFDTMLKNAGGGSNLLVIGLLGSVVFLIVAFVFFAVACMFIVRYIILLVLLMLSPVAYMGMALPFVDKYSKDWWKALNNQLLFAPIYMVMTLVIVALISSDGFISKDGNWASLITKDGLYSTTTSAVSATSSSSINLLFNFAVIIGLIIASLVIAKKTSTEGSAHIKDATDKFTTFAGGAVMGGMGRAGRNTLGRLGNRWVNDKDLQDRAANGDLGARMRLATADKMAKSSFDVRATDGFSSLSKQGGLNFGKVDVKKENFQAIREEQNKKIAEGMKLYKPSADSEEQAKALLDSEEFKSKEKKEKEKYLAGEHKNTEVYKKALQAEKDIELLEKTTKETEENNKKVEMLRKREDELAKSGGSLVEADKINKEILEIEEDTKNKQELIKKLQDLDGERKAAIKERGDVERTWMSETMKGLIAQKGGQEKKEKDGKLIQAEVVGLYQERLNRIARREGHEENTNTQLGVRVGANTVGAILNAFGLTSMPKTKPDRADLARKIRALGKAKKPKEEFEELLKKAGIVEEPKEKPQEEPKTPEPEATK